MKRGPGATSRGFRTGRGVGGKRIDPYKADAKARGPAVCGSCGATYQRGRWSWSPRPASAVARVCPACRRTAERQPAGVLRIARDLAERFDEVKHVIRNTEQRERAQHPLERVMSIREERGVLAVETTGLHVAHRIAGALARAFHADLDTEFLREQDLVRIRVSARSNGR